MRAPGRVSIFVLLVISAVVLSMPAAPSAAGAAAQARSVEASQQARIDAAVVAQAAGGGKVTYWVVLRDRADLRRARGLNHEARGRFVVDELRNVAERSQAGLRGLLRARGADFEPFWAANVIKVTSTQATLDLVALRPDVERIEADRVYRIPEPVPGGIDASVLAVEWNIANIRAPEVWSTFGTRGEGIVVASIDTGAQFDHPALVSHYRGALGGSAFDHNYNWYDPSSTCGSPSLAPCDNNGHGTHTMGTIAGDDGGANQIGVAPGARWITAKGCESNSCTTTSLVAAGQWMLAPTDLTGQNPRPDLRPHLVSNSWGGASSDTFYQQVVQNWVAAGIFPVFANGNSGPSCGTVGAPGAYPESYGVGAYDASNLIASFSSRGASFFGVVKPNISAPGVNVRSSVPVSSYAAYSGTSMATPHVAGVVALMWSAAPALVNDVAGTRALLDQTAIDSADMTCGGTAANNNVYGEGRMDAFAAVDLSPRGPTGTLQGTVTDAASHAPLAGMQVRAVGPSTRTTLTNASGGYTFRLPVGSYAVTASGFGYTPVSANDSVLEGAATVRDFALTAAPSATLSGTVRDAVGTPIPNATVTILATPIPPATTDANGAYVFTSVPQGTYDVKAEAGRCNDPQTQSVALVAGQVLNFTLASRSDAFGYACTIVPQLWIDTPTLLALSGDDTYVQTALPFGFDFYGSRYTTANVSTNGTLTFVTPSAAYSNTAIPAAAEPNAAVYALWDDLYVDTSSTVRTGTMGAAPNRQFAVEWRNVAFYGELASRLDVQVVLGENGEVLTQYRNVPVGNGRAQGNSATLGLENPSGTIAFQYSLNEAVITEGLSIRYVVTPFSGVQGAVLDDNDGLALAAATVRVLQGGIELQRMNTDAAGYYHFHLAAGDYVLEASRSTYGTRSSNVTVTAGTTARADFRLPTPRADVSPASLAFTLFVGQSSAQTLTLSNGGGLPLHWTISESGGDVPWLTESPTNGTVAAGGTGPVQVTASAAALTRGSYSATLLVQSDAGRRPSISVPVSLTVNQYDQAVNAGGPMYYGSGGFYWYADAVYTAGTFGYTNAAAPTDTARKAIAGTPDVVLFQTARVNPVEYKFDLGNGTYQVTVGFVEYRKVKVGARVFTVAAEGTAVPVLTNHDLMTHVPMLTADIHTFTVVVNNGQLNLTFTPRAGSLPPVVSAIRVVQTAAP